MNSSWINSRAAAFIDYTGLRPSHLDALLRVGLDVRLNFSHIFRAGGISVCSKSSVKRFSSISAKRFRGITPIPTFSTSPTPRESNTRTCPLLGFEGTRFKHVIETLQHEGQDIIPIIGIPGFSWRFRFTVIEEMLTRLAEQGFWENVRSLTRRVLSLCSIHWSISKRENRKLSTSFPIGTMPHALGAALFAILHPQTELVYDHTVRKKAAECWCWTMP